MIPSYTTDDVLRILHLSEQTLRACFRAASYPSRKTTRQPRFTFQDLLILRTAKGLLKAGISVGRVRKVLASLRRQLPDDQALSHVKIYADGRRVVVWDAAGQWQPDSGQFLLNFDVDEVKGPGKVRTLARRGAVSRTRLTAQQWYERALELEQDSPEEACHAYEEAVKADPKLIEAHLNLGLLHHIEDRLDQAEACYRRAIEYAPDEPHGYFNLGGVLKQKDDRPGAIAAYTAAIERQPDLTEAHEQLALLYDAEGNTTMAFRHGSASYQLKKSRARRARPSRLSPRHPR
ncbi:MAG TPA: tetratricopeptide repeat protein [Nitrospiraceae bacterium]|nr:tetratricopeptide repeat protein [Nitrospiraceae bacterium]